MALTKVTYSMIQGAAANVEDYGATGDGTTDDSAAIQAAIDDIDALGGGTVYFESGKTYSIQTALDVSGDYITLNLNGATLTVPPLTDIETIIVTGKHNVIENGVFFNQTLESVPESKSIKVDGEDTTIRNNFFRDRVAGCVWVMDNDVRTQVLNNSFDMPDKGYPVVYWGDDGLISGNNMTSVNAGIVVGNQGKRVRITDNSISDVFEVGIDLIGGDTLPDAAREITIIGNQIRDCNDSAIRVGTAIAGGLYATNVIIANNILKNFGLVSGYGVDITGRYDGSAPPSTPPQIKIVVTGNIIEGSATSTFGISIAHADAVNVTNNNITSCSIGIGLIDGAKSTIITGNTITDNRTRGIKVELLDADDVSKTLIANNVIYDNGLVASRGVGIELLQGRGCRIINNSIFDDGAAKQGTGIWLRADSQYTSIDQNAIWGHLDNVIQIEAPLTVADFFIGDNFNSVGDTITSLRGESFIPNGSTSVTINPGLVLTPQMVLVTPLKNEFIWVSPSPTATAVVVNRVGTTNNCEFFYEIRMR